MTTFDNSKFYFDGMYLSYGDSYVNSEFVARFKYVKRDRKHFQRFLVANFTVEEYFAQRRENVPPLTILESKGYVCPALLRLQAERAKRERQAANAAAFNAWYDAQPKA